MFIEPMFSILISLAGDLIFQSPSFFRQAGIGFPSRCPRSIYTRGLRNIIFGIGPKGMDTPGMILSSKALLDETPNPTEEEIRRGISGNLCRCTGYIQIVESIKKAAEKT